MFDSQDMPSTAEHLRWRWVPIQRGVSTKGLVAGPVVRLWCHAPNGISKPCRRKLTKGKLDCPSCGKHKLRFIGYLPFYLDPNGSRLVCTLSKTTMELCGELGFGTHFSARMPDPKNQPATVTKSDPGTQGSFGKRLVQRGPQDIREWLFHLWGDAELALHFGVFLEDKTGVPMPPRKLATDHGDDVDDGIDLGIDDIGRGS